MAHILLAEDDPAMQSFIKTALNNAGHTTTATLDGTSALKALEDNETHFDLLLTDIVMPGIDGIELSQKATKLRPDIKIMFITGFAATAQKQSKNTPTLSKPFHLNDLIEQIETILAS